MPKRKISDLWPNECIHCPTEESHKVFYSMYHHYWFNSDLVYASYNHIKNWWLIVSWSDKPKEIIYPRTDFVDEEEKESDTTYLRTWQSNTDVITSTHDISIKFPEWWKTILATWHVVNVWDHIVWWPFKTGDNVEVNIMTYWYEKWRVQWCFYWYTTHWWYIASLPEYDDDLVLCSDCRFIS
jgi:hypothetical protein